MGYRDTCTIFWHSAWHSFIYVSPSVPQTLGGEVFEGISGRHILKQIIPKIKGFGGFVGTIGGIVGIMGVGKHGHSPSQSIS